MSKAHAIGREHHHFTLGGYEIVEVSRTKIKARRFFQYFKTRVLFYAFYIIGKNVLV